MWCGGPQIRTIITAVQNIRDVISGSRRHAKNVKYVIDDRLLSSQRGQIDKPSAYWGMAYRPKRLGQGEN